VQILSTYRQLWRYMRRRGLIETESPWTDLGARPRTTARPPRRGFTDTEAVTYMAVLDGVERDVTMLLAVTGARLEEACALLPGDITDADAATWIEIRAGKTKAARRRVPVVDVQVREMLLMRASRGQERVFHELRADRLGRYSARLQNRLGWRMRRVAGLLDPALVPAHSWRHRARTLLEAAEVPPWTADAFMGHKRPGEGLGRYSKPSDAQLVLAAQAIPLPR
jgi:integrase